MDKLLPPGHVPTPPPPQAPAPPSQAAAATLPPAGQQQAGTAARLADAEQSAESPSSGMSADSNSSVTMAMENLTTQQAAAAAAAAASGGAAAMDTGESAKPKSNPVLHYQIKQIKPLLSGSSRLGRALAELFALLVKLCVGSPLRQVSPLLHPPPRSTVLIKPLFVVAFAEKGTANATTAGNAHCTSEKRRWRVNKTVGSGSLVGAPGNVSCSKIQADILHLQVGLFRQA